MKKAICLTVAVVLLLLTTACNKGSDGSSDNPYVGKWNAVSITALGMTVDVGEAFVRETSLQLGDNESCTVTVDGDSTTGEWNITGGIVRISAGEENFVGLIDNENGFLILELPSHGMNVNFVHQDGNLVPHPRDPEPEPPPGGWRGTDVREWWQGEWFGYMTASGVAQDGTPIQQKTDCYGESFEIVDGEMSMSLWDVGAVVGALTFKVDFSGGVGDKGAATVRGGVMLAEVVEPGDGTSDPELSPYEDQFVMVARSEFDEGGYVEYQIVLRPWGMLWDDVPEGERPPNYDTYLNLYKRPLKEAEILPSHEH